MKTLGSLLLVGAGVALSSSALAAGITINPAQSGTSVSLTESGTTLVDIVAPDANGISHNTYTDFNVGPNGVVLNNSTVRTQTELAGAIAGNANLGGHAASVILNEVVGANASQLGGALELAGADAKVILANPNGIACNGCQFRHIDQLDLVAGAPDTFNGELKGYRIDDGKITVAGGERLDASATDELNLMANAILVEGGIEGNNVNLVANRGHLRPDGTIRSSDSSGYFPKVAISVEELGGVRASNIRLVSGNYGGVGVNIAGYVDSNSGSDSQGNIRIDSYGDINIDGGGVLYAADKLELTTDHSLYNRGRVQAGNATYAHAKDSIDNASGVIGSQNTIDLSANHIYNVGGHIQSYGSISLEDKSWFGVNNTFGTIKAAKSIEGDVPGWFFNIGGTVESGI
ncbi:filamentous hemagglutinin N-terminal domain-containing protein [Halomonas caseinilytica]|uniref:filamentous hemagglutinin N-terminal domain-containing protein n=1 Tax=Halomonas caseinilytica TaxID=438744 RepID=UPI0007E59201|nr:filamentous hemagglutinin N-terminal domain-containing protein [Halomonas caseinilytica]SEM57797.1 filamentous hemagglutinin family N-terminal domain-containing protein [Halomonas caseinilytica]